MDALAEIENAERCTVFLKPMRHFSFALPRRNEEGVLEEDKKLGREGIFLKCDPNDVSNRMGGSENYRIYGS